MTDRTCAVDGCGKPVHARGWCCSHNHRWERYGDPLGRPDPPPPRPLCGVDGCEQPTVARGWCNAHWSRWKATGDVRADVPVVQQARYAPGLLCTVEGCGKPRDKREWCGTHYRRWQRHGDPLTVIVIHGDVWARVESYVDRSGGPDACHLWTGPQNTDGYGQTMVDRKLKVVHVLLWEQENGPKPPGVELDHECHNQAVRTGSCRKGICSHRLCCNLKHIVPRTKSEHVAATMAGRRGQAYPEVA